MNLDYGHFQKLINEKKEALFRSVKNSLNKEEIKKIKLACEVAEFSHFAQKRKSGEPYIIHPLEVATIVADWDLDCPTICGSLLHDVVEDTAVTKEDLAQIFGAEISELVDSVTKLEKINFETEEIAHAEYFRKVVLSMAKDIRVILIKLADRLHNILTLSSMKPEKQRKIALETMEIYVPIANKIGLHRVHLQLAEESFKYLYPFRYKVLQKAVRVAQENRQPIIESIIQNTRGSMKSNGINATFVARQRAIYNIYRRMLRRNFNRVYDIFEVKIIVDNIRECYLALGVLHNLYQPLPGKFKDYIAIPKSNGYQSLHSTVMGPQGTLMQIHIRTKAMEEVAENGIICHWLKNKNNDAFLSANKRTANWISNILDIQASTFSADEFLSNIKQDLYPIDIYVFTPKGKIIILPKGSTPIDFAYFIHSDIGNHCFQAKVNSKLEKLDTPLQNGDIVEIITNPDTEPSHQWLDMVSSGKAVSRIKHYFKERKYDEDVSNGVKLINYALEALGSDIQVNSRELEPVAKEFYTRLSTAELEHNVGVGSLSPLTVAKHIIKIAIDNNEPLEIKLSNCRSLKVIQDTNCLALPSDNVYARITRSGEMVLHKTSCKQNKLIGLDNLSSVHIINDTGKLFLSKIHVVLYNIPGTFNRFSGIIAEKSINIVELTQTVSTEEYATVKATLGVLDVNQIEDLYDTLSETDFVDKVYLI
jgi:guanosine-3',5'-bis(diphosphate) 3'-pyrophosphohydrolase